jgi:selenocysteine lyase/cysteine desulfurase
MRIRNRHPRERGQVSGQKVDAVIDEQTAVDLGRLADEAAFEQVLGFGADAGDERAGVRFSPHFYTTDDEIEIAFATVDEILRTDRWKRQAATHTIVT